MVCLYYRLYNKEDDTNSDSFKRVLDEGMKKKKAAILYLGVIPFTWDCVVNLSEAYLEIRTAAKALL